MPCMNVVSAAVCFANDRGGATATVVVGWPGAPGFTMTGGREGRHGLKGQGNQDGGNFESHGELQTVVIGHRIPDPPYFCSASAFSTSKRSSRISSRSRAKRLMYRFAIQTSEKPATT